MRSFLRRGRGLLRGVSLLRRDLFPRSGAWFVPGRRGFAASTLNDVSRLRNIGVSAHIDSGKTTFTERVLYYTGRVAEIHDVRGRDGVGAKMDSMDLEREKGITIQSAATYVSWGDHHINIIDTPGHVDFTIEVERALRVLDGAVMVLCSVAGVQSQSMTVDKQMKRYKVPRVTFINKMDRVGADPWQGIKQLREVLGLTAAAVQIPIGLENEHEGNVCLLRRRAFYFDGARGEIVREADVPDELQDEVEEKRQELLATLADADDEIGEMFLMEEEPTEDQLRAAIRRATIALKFTPVFMGSAFKNKGVQSVLDGVCDYLPNPSEVENKALEGREEKELLLQPDPKADLVALAFKMQETKFGQLTYLRIYQGTIKKGSQITDVSTQKKVRLQRLIRMHSDEMEDVQSCGPGEIVAIFGIDCVSGVTFTSGARINMTSMFVPDPVISLSIKVKDRAQEDAFAKALNRFTREDPTFRVHLDKKTKETIISGMGELHLDVYVERMKREYNVDCIVGEPKVAYRETLTQRAEFDFLQKKQTGGQGQYGRVIGYMEPTDETEHKRSFTDHFKNEFWNELVGMDVPPEYYPAIQKGFYETAAAGPLTGNQMYGVRFVVQDGASHCTDSSEIAFKLAARGAVFQGFQNGAPRVTEPIMAVEVDIPSSFQGAVVGGLNRRRGMINSVDAKFGDYTCVRADVPLSSMFGYSTELRSQTEGKGEFSMEYKEHAPVSMDLQKKLIQDYREEREAKAKN